LRLINRQLKGAWIQMDQCVSRMHELVVVHVEGDDSARDPGADGGRAAIDEGIVRTDFVTRAEPVDQRSGNQQYRGNDEYPLDPRARFPALQSVFGIFRRFADSARSDLFFRSDHLCLSDFKRD
jgi:hypothetical protein